MTCIRSRLDSRVVRILVPLLTYAGVTAALFLPLLLRLGSGLHDRSDTLLNTWIVNWQAHILPRDPLALFDAPIFHPLHDTLALSEILWPAAPGSTPVLAATGNPVLVYNLLFLGSFLLAGFGMYLLALRVTGSWLAAFVAGLIYAFSPHQFGHLSQLQLLSIGWLPLSLLFLERFWIGARPRDGLLLALTIAAQTLSAFYYGFQVVLVVAVYLFCRVVASPSRHSLRKVARLVPWGALSALMVAPFAVPYLRVQAGLGLERSLAEAMAASPGLTDYLMPRAGHPLYDALFGNGLIDGGGLFLGLVPLACAVIGFVTWRPRRTRQIGRVFWLLTGLAGITLSLGPRLKWVSTDPGGLALPFGWLYSHVPGMTMIRAPGRFGVTAFMALALLAAAGLAWLLRRLSSRSARVALTGVMGMLCLIEYTAGLGPFAVQPMPSLNPPPPVYAWLAQQPAAAIVELPLTSEMARPPITGAGSAAGQAWPDYNLIRYQYFGMTHWQPNIDGYSGFVPPHHRELGLTMADFPAQRSLAMLRGLDVEWVVIHSEIMEAFRPGHARVLAARLANTPGITHERDFGPDWVYRVRPAPAPSVTGKFWVADSGDAFLILSVSSEGTAVLRPDRRLTVRGAWQPTDGREAISFKRSMHLPLLVGETSVVPLDLARPEVPGDYTLRLDVADADWLVAPYARSVTILSEVDESRLLAIQAMPSPEEWRATPGELVTLDLAWRLTDRPDGDYSVAVRILGPDGQVVAQKDQPLSDGRDLVRTWMPGMVITTTFHLPLPNKALGRHSVLAFIYRPGEHVDYVFLGEDGTPTQALRHLLVVKPDTVPTTMLPPASSLAEFGGEIYLLAADVQPPIGAGESFEISLAWTANRRPEKDYTVFAHVMNQTGEIVAQHDGQPQSGRYPTGIWNPGEVVSDAFAIMLPAETGGQTVCLQMGLYDANTLERLPRTDAAGDFWQEDTCWAVAGRE